MGKKKILSVIVTLGLVLSISNTALGQPVSDLNTLLNQKNQQQQQMKNDESALKKLESESQSLGTEIEKMDSQIEGQMRTLSENKNKIQATQNQIAATQKEIEKAEIEIKAEKVLFDKRMRVMYINGTGGYVGILLGSKNFGDFYLKIETIKKVVEYDNKIIEDLKAKREVINQKKIVLDKTNSDLLVLKAENEKKMAKLNETKNSQKVLVAKSKVQQDGINARINTANLNLASIDKKIAISRGASIAAAAEAARKSATNPVAGSGTVSGGSSTVAYAGNDAVVAFAYKFMGLAYVWGGTTPSGFDCSGFVQYVYAHFGVGISRVTTDQIHDGSAVSRDQLRSGDLVFFGSPSEPHHVGMYVGNDEYIHAPKTGDVIKVSSLSGRSDYAGARRVK